MESSRRRAREWLKSFVRAEVEAFSAFGVTGFTDWSVVTAGLRGDGTDTYLWMVQPRDLERHNAWVLVTGLLRWRLGAL